MPCPNLGHPLQFPRFSRKHRHQIPRSLSKAAKYLFPFSYHLLDYLMDVGKGGAKRANHLFKTFAPLLLARKGVEFHEINGHKVVPPAQSHLD